MSTYRHQRRVDLFVVRVWREDVQDAQGTPGESEGASGVSGGTEWCGMVQRAVDGESHQFRGWQGLTDLLLAMITQKEGR
jgi:hypothetical protein